MVKKAPAHMDPVSARAELFGCKPPGKKATVGEERPAPVSRTKKLQVDDEDPFDAEKKVEPAPRKGGDSVAEGAAGPAAQKAAEAGVGHTEVEAEEEEEEDPFAAEAPPRVVTPPPSYEEAHRGAAQPQEREEPDEREEPEEAPKADPSQSAPQEDDLC